MNDTCNQPLTAAYSWNGGSTAGIADQEAGYVNEFPPTDQGGSSRKKEELKKLKEQELELEEIIEEIIEEIQGLEEIQELEEIREEKGLIEEF